MNLPVRHQRAFLVNILYNIVEIETKVGVRVNIRACSWCEVKVIGSKKVMVKFDYFSEKSVYIRPSHQSYGQC